MYMVRLIVTVAENIVRRIHGRQTLIELELLHRNEGRFLQSAFEAAPSSWGIAHHG